MAIQTFLMDGVAYNVHVMSLRRKFSVLDSPKTGRTQNGNMYRDPIGTYYNYTMTVAPAGNDVESIDAFWDAVSQPKKSHVCVFPYNQETLTQKMYVTSGEQPIRLLTNDATHWGEITVNYIAMTPKVVP